MFIREGGYASFAAGAGNPGDSMANWNPVDSLRVREKDCPCDARHWQRPKHWAASVFSSILARLIAQPASLKIRASWPEQICSVFLYSRGFQFDFSQTWA